MPRGDKSLVLIAFVRCKNADALADQRPMQFWSDSIDDNAWCQRNYTWHSWYCEAHLHARQNAVPAYCKSYTRSTGEDFKGRSDRQASWGYSLLIAHNGPLYPLSQVQVPCALQVPWSQTPPKLPQTTAAGDSFRVPTDFCTEHLTWYFESDNLGLGTTAWQQQ